MRGPSNVPLFTPSRISKIGANAFPLPRMRTAPAVGQNAWKLRSPREKECKELSPLQKHPPPTQFLYAAGIEQNENKSRVRPQFFCPCPILSPARGETDCFVPSMTATA